MAKKMFGISSLCCILGLAALSSCGNTKSDDELVEEKTNELIVALEANNEEAVRNLFAKTKIENEDTFTASIQSLFEYYDGAFISKKNNPHGKFQDKDGKFETTWFLPSVDVTTSKETYRIAYYYCTEYTTDKDSVGIWSLYIIKMEDSHDSKDVVYRGDGLWTPGIHIGKEFVSE